MTTTESIEPRDTAATEPGKTGRRPRTGVILALCCLAQFMVILDLSIVNVALPSIQVGLKFSGSDLQWVVDAYAILFGGTLMLAGRATDIIGQRRTFIAAFMVFGLASLLGGLAPTSGTLIIARGIQGLGGALMAASSLAIITSTFEAGPARHRAVALWGSMNGAGGAAGTFFGGLITEDLSWRWVLLINAPIAIIALCVAAKYVQEQRTQRARSFDLFGAVLLTGGLLLEAYGAVTAGTDGWGSASALVPIAIGTVVLTIFPMYEKRAKQPLIPPKSIPRQLKQVNLVVLLFSAAIFPMWYVGSLYLQQVLSLTPISTGLCFLPMALLIFVCAQRAGKLVGRYGVRPVLTGGLVLMAAGMALSARIGVSGSAIYYIVIPGLLLCIGIGLSVVSSTIAAVQSAGPDQAGLASGLVNTARQVGGGLGLAVIISIATLYSTHEIGHNQQAPVALMHGFSVAYLICAGLVACAAVLALFTAPQRPAAPRGSGLINSPRAVALGTVVVLAVFAAVLFAIPRPVGAAIGKYTTRDTYHYVTAPNLHPPIVKGGAYKAGTKLPGDVLVANFYDVSKPPIAGQSGPLVLGPNLQPLWFDPVPQNQVAANLNEQTYEGQKVLTWWQGDVTATGEILSGTDVVVNDHYKKIATLRGKDGWVPTMHEMIVRGDDAWVTANKNVPTNLSAAGGVSGGSIIDSAVQEYNLKTGKLLYTWDAAKHIPFGDSHATPPSNGFPWDVYHINALDVLDNGTMLVSMRNTWAAYLVNIKSGKVIWQLGGKHSSFKIPAAAHFEWQHDVQMLNSDTVTMFDDHCCDISSANTYLPATGSSRGLRLHLDFSNHTVKVAQVYTHGTTFESEYMGNVQTLRGGDAFVGWGEVPYMSLFSKSGKLLYDAVFPQPDISYRAYLKTWVGKPLTSPVAKSVEKDGKTNVYVSWNGATQVRSWRVIAAGAATTVVARARDNAFETAIPLSHASGQLKVEALDASGRVIGTSNTFTSKT
jgi:EmrB/QacA subfamily drug resistance transporter